MKIACIADIHAHNFKEFATISDKTDNSRLDEIILGLNHIGKYCVDNNIYFLIIAGDLFHKRGAVDTVVYNAVFDWVETWSQLIHILMVVGNHDTATKKVNPEHSMHAFHSMHNVIVVDKPGVVWLDELTPVYCIPFNRDGKGTKEILANPPDTGDILPILVAHLGVSGAFVGADSYMMQDYFTVEDLHPELYKYGVLGHYHSPQFLKDTKHFFYCGSPIQHSFNDAGDRGFMVVDTDKRYDVKFVKVPGPSFRTISNYKNIDLQSLSGSFVRFVATPEEIKDLIPKLPPGLQYKIMIKKSHEVASRSDIRMGMSFEQIITKYAEKAPKAEPALTDIGLELLKEVMESDKL